MAEEPEDVQLRVLKHLLEGPPSAEVTELLFDSVTGLPTLQLLLPRIREGLTEGKEVGLLSLSIAQLSKLEEFYGWESFDETIRGLASCLKSVKEECLRKDDALAELTVNGNVFVLLLSPPRTKRSLSRRDLLRVRERLRRKLDSYLSDTLGAELVQRVAYFIGVAVIRREASVRLERLVYRAVDEGLAEAASQKAKSLRNRARALVAILERGRIWTVYEPLLDLRSQTVVGYEALSRGPPGQLRAPDILFKVAYETDLVLKLERLCREHALRALPRLGPEQLLFINTEPLSVFDRKLSATEVVAGSPGRVVFEITERAAVADFSTFRHAVRLLKHSGFKIAVDDVGAAYSGLRVISEIEPDFIKLDMQLSRGAHGSGVKQHLINAIVRFCKDARLSLIAEGIETREELEAVASLGIHLVQGFLFGSSVDQPGEEKVEFPALLRH